MKVKIEKGVPMPDEVYQFPWEDMEPGDSFLIPAAPSEIETTKARIYHSAYRCLGRGRITLRRVKGGVRAWLKENNNA